jgi:hypothetical protein
MYDTPKYRAMNKASESNWKLIRNAVEMVEVVFYKTTKLR